MPVPGMGFHGRPARGSRPFRPPDFGWRLPRPAAWAVVLPARWAWERTFVALQGPSRSGRGWGRVASLRDSRSPLY